MSAEVSERPSAGCLVPFPAVLWADMLLSCGPGCICRSAGGDCPFKGGAPQHIARNSADRVPDVLCVCLGVCLSSHAGGSVVGWGFYRRWLRPSKPASKAMTPCLESCSS